MIVKPVPTTIVALEFVLVLIPCAKNVADIALPVSFVNAVQPIPGEITMFAFELLNKN